MNFAKQKVQLFQIVVNADKEITGKLIELANQLKNKNEKFAGEDLAKFHASRQAYLEKPEDCISLEKAHAYIRSLKKK